MYRKSYVDKLIAAVHPDHEVLKGVGEVVDIDLSDEDKESLIDIWLKERLSPESYQVLQEQGAEAAVLNESIIAAIKRGIEKDRE